MIWVTTLSTSAAPSYYYDQAYSAYKNHQYEKAYQLANKGIQSSPKNAKLVFLMGLTQAKLKEYESAKASFTKVLELTASSDPLAQKARNNIQQLTNKQVALNGNAQKAQQIKAMAGSGQTNYLAYALPDGKVVRWDKRRMPLKVFIENGQAVPGWHAGLVPPVLKAMATWQQATNGMVKLTQTANIKQADIVVHWQVAFAENKVGENPNQIMGNVLVRSDVTLATSTSSGQRLPAGTIYLIALHELGHALGIKGHSPNPNDIMYYTTNPRSSGKLTLRDKNTLVQLYRLQADIKNDQTISANQAQNFYGIYQQAVQKHTAGQAAAAIPLYEKALKLKPGDRDTTFNLAVAYEEQQQDDKAVGYYRKILLKNSNDGPALYNLGTCYFNLGVTATRKRQWPEASSSFENAVYYFERITTSGRSHEFPGVNNNLDIARKNLAVVKQYTQKSFSLPKILQYFGTISHP